jgi:hypothetical protein
MENSLDQLNSDDLKQRPGCWTNWLWINLLVSSVLFVISLYNLFVNPNDAVFVCLILNTLFLFLIPFVLKWNKVAFIVYLITLFFALISLLTFFEFHGANYGIVILITTVFPAIYVGFVRKAQNGRTITENFFSKSKSKTREFNYCILDLDTLILSNSLDLGDFIVGYRENIEKKSKYYFNIGIICFFLILSVTLVILTFFDLFWLLFIPCVVAFFWGVYKEYKDIRF